MPPLLAADESIANDGKGGCEAEYEGAEAGVDRKLKGRLEAAGIAAEWKAEAGGAEDGEEGYEGDDEGYQGGPFGAPVGDRGHWALALLGAMSAGFRWAAEERGGGTGGVNIVCRRERGDPIPDKTAGLLPPLTTRPFRVISSSNSLIFENRQLSRSSLLSPCY